MLSKGPLGVHTAVRLVTRAILIAKESAALQRDFICAERRRQEKKGGGSGPLLVSRKFENLTAMCSIKHGAAIRLGFSLPQPVLFFYDIPDTLGLDRHRPDRRRGALWVRTQCSGGKVSFVGGGMTVL